LAIADILYGRVNPGGKLPFTIAAQRQDYGTDIMYTSNNGQCTPQDNFSEGIFIDYRWLDKKNITPIFEFGFGLSYTTFSYTDLNIQASASVPPYSPNSGMTEPAPISGNFSTNPADYAFPPDISPINTYIYPYLTTNITVGGPSGNNSAGLPVNSTNGAPQPMIRAGGAPGGNPRLYDVLWTVSVTIQNTGEVAGDEVVQLYISLGGPNDAPKVLRGFERVHNLAPGQSQTVSMSLCRKDLMNWNSTLQDWGITQYQKTVYVGGSSRNLPLSQKLQT
jgi:beta-glucosidase